MRQSLPWRPGSGGVAAFAEVPYARDETTVGIVHIGVGAFHRAHLAEYVDDVLASGDLGWAICGVGLLEDDRPLLAALRDQEGLYTRTCKNSDGSWATRTIGAITEVLLAPDDPGVVLARMADPQVRIVSMTITEGAYLIDEVTGVFDLEAAALASDLVEGLGPQTVFGYLVEALDTRWRAGHPPFTVLSCDNLPGNGDAIRQGTLAVAARRDPSLADWIARNAAFPNSMVDRITPAATEADLARLDSELGLIDRVPVVCEPFRQWVVEDAFCAGRPAFEHHGAQLVSDVGPYEQAKLRLLNGGHQALAHAGRLFGHRYVHEATCDPLLLNLLLGYFAEVRATIESTPDLNLQTYTRQLIARFSNPEMKDPLDRISSFASDRIPKWVVPPLRENLLAGRNPVWGAAVIACWHRGLLEAQLAESVSAVPDRRSAELRAILASEDPGEFVDQHLFGDLSEVAGFRESYRALVGAIASEGLGHQIIALLHDDIFEAPTPVRAPC